ncbi:MAG: SusC/RagA family TonB-linked outer membrane protein [Dysgonamonadaceae bacterium]|nr:SusC/RagA family TonB-linked outer membrane protein [Dysgonamonadaceae bacterium]
MKIKVPFDCKRVLHVLFMLFLSCSLFSQITVDIKNRPLKDALKEIESKGPFKFFYNNDMDGLDKTVSLKVADASIDSALRQLLSGTEISYQKQDNNIILLIPKTSGLEQEGHKKVIQGKVVDDIGDPLVGVSVVVEGSANGTMTDVNGAFTIHVKDEKSVLVISYVGYNSQRITVGKNTYIQVNLKENNKMLEEVVVIGYNTVKKKDLTTAVAIVSTEDLNERPIISAAQAIQGKAAGVQVIQPSGHPGSGLSIRVRGATSISASNEPLYVVDGYPMDGISNLSANDIESMQILKDASSAAIYGARAANGVVLITTKKGKAGSRTVNFSSYVGFSKLGKKINALNTEQYKDFIKDLNKYINAPITISDEETRYTDWTDAFYGTGVNQNYQLSLSSGTDKIKYFISAGYLDEKGIVEKAYFNRYNFRTNIENQQTDWLKMGVTLAYSKASGRSVYENRSSMRAGSILSVINTPPYMQKWDPDNPNLYDEFAYGARILNPFAANAADRTSGNSRFVGSMYLDFSLARNLHYKASFGINEVNSLAHYYLDPVSSSDGRSTKGRIDEGWSKDFEWLWENLVTYENKFKDKHNLSILGGATLQRAKGESADLGGYDLLDTYDIRTLTAANIIDKNSTTSSASMWSLASFLTRVAYDYESKYLISANVRADGSSRFSPGKRWGIFPSVSAGWRISGESFMEKTSDVISDLKLRAGWGLNGNQGGIGNYSWRAQFSANKVSPTTENSLPGMSLSMSTPGNRELTWEKTTQTNVGIDLSMFRSRLIFTIDAYYKYTTDMLMNVSLPSYANIPGGITRNDAEMKNKGLEFAVSSRNIDTRKLKWNTDFNISFNKNEVTKLGLNKVYYYAGMYTTGQSAIILREGYSLGTFYGYVSQGVDPETGNIIYEDRNKNGIIDPEDRTKIGNAQPLCFFGMTNTLSYANFNLSVFFQGLYGNDIFNASKIDMTGMTDFRNQSTDVLRRWKRPGMETDIPRPGNAENINNSSRFVEDGSYLRLKSLTLSYDFGQNSTFLRKAGIGKIQPYITMQNLWTWTKYSGYDPEVNAYGSSSVALGVDYGTYPQSKSVIFGVNVEF